MPTFSKWTPQQITLSHHAVTGWVVTDCGHNAVTCSRIGSWSAGVVPAPFLSATSAHKLYKGSTIALFMLATIYTTVYTWGVCGQTLLAFNAATTKDYTSFLQYGHGDDGKTAWVYLILYTSTIGNMVSTLMNSIADAMLIVLTFLTGGRIWWITSEARKLGARSTHSKFNDIMAIIVILGNVVWNASGVGTVPFDFLAVSTLVSGLAPTIVIAQVAYGRSVDSIQQELSIFHIAEVQASQQRSSATRQATIDLHTQSQHPTSGLQEGGSLQAIEESDADDMV
ncbi:hypothetical protein L218DRAFT_947700 [Marasmius fiardii PR-910]|nr:hypothetical protein L218DRAFT_947700 [Marasmius fiardii PR-910]